MELHVEWYWNRSTPNPTKEWGWVQAVPVPLGMGVFEVEPVPMLLAYVCPTSPHGVVSHIDSGFRPGTGPDPLDMEGPHLQPVETATAADDGCFQALAESGAGHSSGVIGAGVVCVKHWQCAFLIGHTIRYYYKALLISIFPVAN